MAGVRLPTEASAYSCHDDGEQVLSRPSRLRDPAESHPAPREGCPAPAPSRPVRRPAWCPAARAPALGFHAPALADRLTSEPSFDFEVSPVYPAVRFQERTSTRRRV